MAEGVDDELYWRSTPAELGAILDEIGQMRQQRERQAAHRAGLVASAVYNVHRKKGARPLKPSDFVADSEPDVIRDPDRGREELLAWARAVNEQQEA